MPAACRNLCSLIRWTRGGGLGKRGGFGYVGFLDLVWECCGEIHSGVMKSPQFRLILAKGGVRIATSRGKSWIIGHFFLNLGLSGFSGENNSNMSRKNYPNRPFWMAKLLFYGLE